LSGVVRCWASTPLETATAVAGTLVLIAILVRITGRIYATAIRRVGSRVRLSDALRAAD
jgi:hypothetical protein